MNSSSIIKAIRIALVHIYFHLNQKPMKSTKMNGSYCMIFTIWLEVFNCFSIPLCIMFGHFSGFFPPPFRLSIMLHRLWFYFNDMVHFVYKAKLWKIKVCVYLQKIIVFLVLLLIKITKY